MAACTCTPSTEYSLVLKKKNKKHKTESLLYGSSIPSYKRRLILQNFERELTLKAHALVYSKNRR